MITHRRERLSFCLALLLAVWLVLPSGLAGAADCNGNAIDDVSDIEALTSEDCNANEVPDECEFVTINFGRGNSFFAGDSPEAMLTVDLDGDGVSDLVTGNQATDRSSTLSVLLNRGDGRLKGVTQYAAGERLSALTAADFDEDGDLDLATANSAELIVFQNNGDGTLDEPVGIEVPRFTRFVTTADGTGDGHVDLIVSNTTNDVVSVLAGSGGGAFASPREFVVGERPEFVVAADFDGDGTMDLASANADSASVSILPGTGGGAFGSPIAYEVEGRARALHAADLDGDRSVDLVVETSTALLRLENQGDGTFGEPLGFDLFARFSGIADIDGDGDVDVLAELSSGRELVIFSADGQGRFVLSLTLSLNAWLFDTGDLDADGDLDIAFAVPDTTDVAVLWNGDGELPVTRETFAGSAPHFAILEDFDGDGDIDLTTPDGPTDYVSFYRNPADGVFGERDRYRVAEQGHLFALLSGDLDRDGDIDLVATDRVDHQLAVLLNAGDGTFAPAFHLPTGRQPFHSDTADLDGDGVLDLVSTNREVNTITVYVGDGAGGFPERRDFAVGTDPWGVAHGDFDGDGDNDLVIANATSGDVGLLWNDGKGDFSTVTTIPVARGPHYVGVGDLDGDGDPDIVALSPGPVIVLVNEGAGTFARPRNLQVDDSGYSVTLGDVNLDGILDVLTTHWGPNTINILRGVGDATFKDPLEFTVGDLPKVAAIADLDGDGDIDIVCPNRSDNNIMILRNQSGAPPFNGDFLLAVCTPLDFEKISIPSGRGVADRAAPYLMPARDDEGLIPMLFQNARRFPRQTDLLRAVFPERFSDLTEAGYLALVERRATRDYYAGSVSVLRLPDGRAYGFDVGTESAAAAELLSLDETRAVLERLEASFALRPLVYFPSTTAAREQAASWDAPGFPIVLESEEPPPEEEPEPIAGIPTFELSVPEGLEICGTFGEAGADRDLRQEYELKSVLRLRGGMHTLPTVEDTLGSTLFEELVFGPEGQVVPAQGEGLFSLRRIPGAKGVTTYRFTYAQSFQLGDGRLVEVTIASPLQFRGVGDTSLDGPLELTEEYFTRIVGTEAIRASVDGVPSVRYGSCTYRSLPRVEVRAQLDDGTGVRLIERYLEAEIEIETAPAMVTEAEVEVGGERRLVSDYFRLMYSAFRHNTGPSYWVLFETPLTVAGVDGEVHGVELVSEFPPRTERSAAYLGADLQVLRPVGVQELTRRTLTATTPFRRGDANADGAFNVVDAIALLDHVFRRGAALSCARAGDANADGRLNVLDAAVLVSQIFRGEPVPAPFPDCGLDGGEGGPPCESFAGCE